MSKIPDLYPPETPLSGRDFEGYAVTGTYERMAESYDPKLSIFAPPVPFILLRVYGTGALRLCRPHEVSEWTFAPENEDAPLPQQ